MAAASRPAPNDGLWAQRARVADDWLKEHKVVASATTASLISTFAGFPLDSLKSRLQSSREPTSLPRLAAEVIREEGVGGLWRGFPLPLITISIVRTISFTIYTSTKRILNSEPAAGSTTSTAALRTPFVDSHGHDGTGPNSVGASQRAPQAGPWLDWRLGVFNRDKAGDVAITSALAGAASGAVVCVGSAPFELVKVRRQLEYQIYRDSHPELFVNPAVSSTPSAAGNAASARAPAQPRPPIFKPPTTRQAVKLIVDAKGLRGLYTGWRLHFIRDTLGTALYFAEYDVMRYHLGRRGDESGGEGHIRGGGLVQGDVPSWTRGLLPKQVIPFLCGSLAGVSSWALIYPVDAIKTKAQQRALSGLEPRTPLTQFMRLVRGTDPDHPKPLLTGIGRLYRGLGVSMIRSMLTHGLLWTIVDWAGGWIDTRPFSKITADWDAR